MLFLSKALLSLFTFTSFTPILSSPTPIPDAAEAPAPLITREEHTKRSQSISTSLLTRHLLTRQAGLAWGPIYIGNLKLSLTNPHNGYAGPKFPNANHVNFHVDKEDPGPRKTYSEVVNMHIVKYSPGGAGGGGGGSWKRDDEAVVQGELEKRAGDSCLYAWDSVTKTVVFDSCFDDFTDAIGEAVSAIKGFVDELLRNADTIAYIAIIAALVAALAAAIASLGVVAVA